MPLRLLDPTSVLFAENVTVAPGSRVFVLNHDDPVFARWLADAVGPSGHVLALHPSYRVLNALAAIPHVSIDESVYPDPVSHGEADIVLLAIPKGRDFTRAYLWAAARVLASGGRLYIAGANAAGAKTAIKDAAALLGRVPVLAYKRSHRIAVALRQDDDPAVPEGWGEPLPWEAQPRTITLSSGKLTVITMPGVFSWEHLDDGTALLLDGLEIDPKADVLDLGCGYGVIGLVAAQSGARVVMVDDNLLAVRCARASAEANGLADRCEIVAGDVTRGIPDRRFDLVLSNPPFHKGLEVNTQVAERIVKEAYDVLRVPGGRLRIVANRFLPYDAFMFDLFGDFETVAETGRFHVLEAVRTKRHQVRWNEPE